MESGASKKKRVRPPRKIVRRRQMGQQWVVAPLVLAGLIVVAGVIFLLTR
jgi:hypothetical protein